MARFRLFTCLLFSVVALTAGALGQDPPDVIIRPGGPQYGFRDGDHFVWVFLGGVEVVQGARTMAGRQLVLLLSAGGDAHDNAPPAEGVTVSGSRVQEIYLEGDVTVAEGSELIVGAGAVFVDNRSGTVSVVDGEWRTTYSNVPMVVRFERLRAMDDGRRQMEGVRYTTCDYQHLHWLVSTPWARVEPTEAGRILTTSGNTIQVGSVPVFWWPGVHLNLDRGDLPIRKLRVGSSSRFGTEVITVWGGDASAAVTDLARWFGREQPIKAEWQLELDYLSDRGYFIEPSIDYETESSIGEIFGAFIRDSAKTDSLDQPITDDTRGRIDIRHRTQLDEHRTVDVELSYIGDRSFLKEFYEHEFRVGKQQETYVWYRDVRDNEALTALFRTRLNEFDTQVEYLPEVERRSLAVPLPGWGGALHTSKDFISHARLVPDDDTKSPSLRHLRVGHRSQLDWAMDVGGDRLHVTAAADLTHFSKTVDRGGEPRAALLGAVRWDRTYVGSREAHSDTWNIDGLRHILEPSIGYSNVFALNVEPVDLVAIDELESLSERQAVTLGLRHRIQTHQHGKVVSILDTDISIPFFPNEDRDNLGNEPGLIALDTRWTPGANVRGLRTAAFRWRAFLDPNERTYRQSFFSYSANIDAERRLFLSHNKALHAFSFFTLGVQWPLTDRWTAAAFWSEDLRANETNEVGFLLRQTAHRWFIDLTLESRRGRGVTTGANKDETRFSINFSPAFLRSDESMLEKIRGRTR